MSLCSSFPSVKCSTKEVGIKLLSNHGLILTASNAAFSLVTTFLVFFFFLKSSNAKSQSERCWGGNVSSARVLWIVLFLHIFYIYIIFHKGKSVTGREDAGHLKHTRDLFTMNPRQHPLQHGCRDRRWALGKKILTVIMFQSLEISMLFCFHYTYNWLFYSLSPIVNPLISSLEAP